MIRTIVSVDRVTTESDDPYIVTDEEVVQKNVEDLLVAWFGYDHDPDEEGLFHVDDVDQFKTRVNAVTEMAEGDIEFTITVLDAEALDIDEPTPPTEHGAANDVELGE